MPFGSTSREHRIAVSTARVAAAVLSVWIAAAGSAPGQATTSDAAGPRSQAAAFRSATELVAVHVSVVDGRQRYVADLGADDFAVYEEGTRQTVTLFAAASAPLDVMLLVDTSGSMFGRMDVTQEAAISFVRRLRPVDRAAVMLFNTRARIVQPLTSDKAALEAAIHSISPGGDSAVYQAVYIALRELAKGRKGEDRLLRQALVVLSDGEDNKSSLTFEDTLAEARRSPATIYTIVPTLDVATAFESGIGRSAGVPFEMRALAEQTGGRSFAPTRADKVAGTYGAIADELSQQYWLGYIPRSSKGGFRRISVRVVSRPGLIARTRSGYDASTPRRSAP